MFTFLASYPPKRSLKARSMPSSDLLTETMQRIADASLGYSLPARVDHHGGSSRLEIQRRAGSQTVFDCRACQACPRPTRIEMRCHQSACLLPLLRGPATPRSADLRYVHSEVCKVPRSLLLGPDPRPAATRPQGGCWPRRRLKSNKPSAVQWKATRSFRSILFSRIFAGTFRLERVLLFREARRSF